MTYLRCVVWRRVFQEVAVKLLAGAAVRKARLGQGNLFQGGSITRLLAGGISSSAHTLASPQHC